MILKKIVSINCMIRNTMIAFFVFVSIQNIHAQYFKTRFSFNESTNEISFYIRPTAGSIFTDLGSFQFDVTYPIGSVINFGTVTNNTVGFPGLDVSATNLFSLNGEWVQRWEHQGFIPFNTYQLNTEYLVFSVVVSGTGTLTLNYKSDYPNFDPVFTVNSDDGTPLWDNTAPYDVYYPTQFSTGDIVYMTLDVTLPVELSSFSTQIKGHSVFLDWATSSEQNLMGFDVERSVDGKVFKKIGFEKSKGGSKLTNYHFEDQSVDAGKLHFYRLKMMDLDGKYIYSNIQFVRMPISEQSIEIMPNPASKVFQIKLNSPNSGTLQVELYDQQGRLKIRKQANILDGDSILEVDTDGVRPGNYFLRFISSQEIVSKRISIVE